MDFLYILHSNKVLMCHKESTLWRMAAGWMEEVFKGDFDLVLTRCISDFQNMRSKKDISSADLEKATATTCLGIILFLSSQDFDHSMTARFFQEVLFKQPSNRAYDGDRYQLNDEEWSRPELFSMLSIIRMFEAPDSRRGRDFLSYHQPEQQVDIFMKHYRDSIDFENLDKRILGNLFSLAERIDDDTENIERAKIYFLLLTKYSLYYEFLSKSIFPTSSTPFDLVKSGFSSRRKVPRFIAMQALHFLVTSSTQSVLPDLVRILIEIKFEHIPLLSEEQRENDIQNRDEQRIWGKLSGEYLGMKILVTGFKINIGIETSPLTWKSLSETLETGGRECLLPCLELAIDLEIVSGEFLMTAKRFIFEFRKNEVFWPSLSLLVRICMKNIHAEPDCVVDIFSALIEESETVAGIFPLLMSEMFKHFPHSKALTTLSPIMAKALTYGPVFRKDQKFVTDVNEMIFSLGPNFEANMCEGSDHLMTASVRVNALILILYRLNNERMNKQIASQIVLELFRDLQGVNVETTGGRQRHFENSSIHKVRHRLCQVYVMLCPLLVVDHATLVLEELGTTLMRHSEQASVRQSMEWAVAIILSKHPDLLDKVWAWLEEAGETKPGAAASFLIIISGHLVTRDPGDDIIEQLERGLREVAPWAMAQNFYTRIVAQICFRKLWTRVEKTGGELRTKFKPLHECILKSVNPKNADKITEDFYLTVFDPLICLNIEDILHNFPKVCDISDSEIIPKELLAEFKDFCHHIPLTDDLSKLHSAVKQRTKKNPQLELNEGQSTNIQKKPTPWTAMMTDKDLMFDDRKTVTRTQAHPGLVVVASLIDKAPNLGGLCRTCEILGVGELVIGNKNIVSQYGHRTLYRGCHHQQ